jgi:hypothetical protein
MGAFATPCTGWTAFGCLAWIVSFATTAWTQTPSPAASR